MPPKGHVSSDLRLAEIEKASPRRRTNDSARPLLLQAALEAAHHRGYQALRISDITDPADVTRQAFYAHFRDKRHCLCEALDPHLAAIERLASSLDPDQPAGRLSLVGREGLPAGEGALGPQWSAEILAAIDELLTEHFGSAEGTKGRLIEALAAELERASSLAGIRIGNLVKRAHVPQGDFYRHFSGKRECFAVLYAERLEALGEATRLEASRLADGETPTIEDLLTALGNELEADTARARILILGEGELPPGEDTQSAGTRRGSLSDAVAGLIDTGREPRADGLILGALIEVIRTALLADDLDALGRKLLGTHRAVAGGEAGVERALAA